MTKSDFAHGYLIFTVLLIAIRVIVKLCCLASSDYPRVMNWKRTDDVVYIFFGIALCAALAWALS